MIDKSADNARRAADMIGSLIAEAAARCRAEPGDLCAAMRMTLPANRCPVLLDMEVIVRHQDQGHCASITRMIRRYVARRAKVIFDHPHNAALGASRAGPNLRSAWPGLTAAWVVWRMCPATGLVT